MFAVISVKGKHFAVSSSNSWIPHCVNLDLPQPQSPWKVFRLLGRCPSKVSYSHWRGSSEVAGSKVCVAEMESV